MRPAGNVPRLSMPTRKVGLIAVFTAVSLATNYAIIGIPNVKLMDAIVFIGAFLFGLEVGLGSAVCIWTVYGFINPWGQDSLPLLSFLIIGECFYALAGALLSRTTLTGRLFADRTGRSRLKTSIIFGLVGFQATFAYDVLTNFGSWVFQSSSMYQALVIGMITGAPFAVVHEISNLIFFATVVPLAIIVTRKTGLASRLTI